MAERAPWLTAMQRTTVTATAAALGLKVTRPHGASGGSILGCPACGAERRHASSRDRRGAIGIRPERRGWRCFECDASGDSIDLVAFQLEGTRFRDLNTDGRARVAEWSRGFTGTSLVTYLSPLAAEPAPITYPPDHQVRALWRRGTPVCGPVADYLAGRRIDPGAVADRDLARVLPVDGLPPWASLGGRSWADTGHHLLVPCFDERGAMCSLLARNTRGGAPKSLGPSGYGRRGLIMADSLARQLLHDGERPEWFGEHEVRIAIAEGEIDFLLAATAAGDADEYAHASLGIFSGSLTDQIAARIPYGSKIIIATDHDEQGERYARSIAQALRSARRHLDLRRWQPIQGGVS